MKFKRLLFNYVHPALSVTQERVTGLWFVVLVLNGTSSIEGDFILKVIHEYMRFSMRIKQPELNTDYLMMKSEIEGKIINLEKIIDN